MGYCCRSIHTQEYERDHEACQSAIVQDDVFESKEEIAHTIKDELTKSMTGRAPCHV